MKNFILKFTRLKLVIIVFLAVLFLFLGIYTSWRSYHGSTDFDTYYYAGKRVLARESLYAEKEGVSPYIYPPFFACLIAPITVFNIAVSSFIWYLLNLVFFAFSMTFSFLLIFGTIDVNAVENRFPFLPKALFLAVTAVLFFDNISMLQANILMFFAAVMGVYFFRKKMNIPAGLFFAMAISIKIIPILFLFYFIVKREFKTSLSIIVWTAVFSVLVPSLYMGFENMRDALIWWNTNMLERSTSLVPNKYMVGVMLNPENQSLKAFLSRWLIENDRFLLHVKKDCHEFYPFMINWTLSLTQKTTLYISKIATVLLAAVTFACCLGKKEKGPASLLNYEFSLIFLICLISNPVLRTQQFVFLIFPALFALSRIVKTESGYRFFYISFLCFASLYLLQGIRILKIFGFGTLSILWIWLFILGRYCKESAMLTHRR